MKHLLRSLLVLALALSVPLRAADISITPGDFRAGATAQFYSGMAGATITAGQLVAISASTGRYVLADANDAVLCKVAGIAAHAAIDGAPLAVVYYSNDMSPGGTLSTVTMVYVLSATAGGIAPAADLSAGGLYPHACIMATSATTCVFRAPGLLGTAVSVAP
jgi:hypothetical protein